MAYIAFSCRQARWEIFAGLNDGGKMKKKKSQMSLCHFSE